MGWRTSPITGAQEFHNAMDLVNGNPTTPILASNDGQVVQAGSNYYDWYGRPPPSSAVGFASDSPCAFPSKAAAACLENPDPIAIAHICQ